MGEQLVWEDDSPLELKDGTRPTIVIRALKNTFIISTTPNRFESQDLDKATRVTLYYNGEYKEHRYWGTLDQMKSLAQQIHDNQELFKRFTYLDVRFSNSESCWWGEPINFDSL